MLSTDALLPGDPARALRLAQAILDQPLMSNHARGLWGYTGDVADDPGRRLTIQSTGIGAASGAVVLAELAGLGVRRVVRVGTCRALPAGNGSREPKPGEILVVQQAAALDGVSSGLSAGGNGDLLSADRVLTEALVAGGCGEAATVLGEDPLAPAADAAGADQPHPDAIATDLQAAALIAVGLVVEVAVGCVCLVSESADGGELLSDDEVMEASVEIGRLVAGAMSPGQEEFTLE